MSNIQNETQTETTQKPSSRHKSKYLEEIFTNGFSVEIIAWAAAFVLAILGLSRVAPTYLAAITTIVVSAALFLKAGGIAGHFRKLSAETGGTFGAEAELGVGMSAEYVAGIAGLVLGVLAVVEILPTDVISCAVIIFGTALVLSSGKTYRFGKLHIIPKGNLGDRIVKTIGKNSVGLEIMVGVAAIVLGILALAGESAIILVLVSLLSIAAVELVTSITANQRMAMSTMSPTS